MKKFILFILTVTLIGCGGGTDVTNPLDALDEGDGPTISDSGASLDDIAAWAEDVLDTVESASFDLLFSSNPPAMAPGNIDYEEGGLQVVGETSGWADGSLTITGFLTALPNEGTLNILVPADYFNFSSETADIIFEQSSSSLFDWTLINTEEREGQTMDVTGTLSVSGRLGAKLSFNYHTENILIAADGSQIQNQSGTVTIISGGQQYDCRFRGVDEEGDLVVCE